DKSSGIITSWAWTFGDGATSTVQNPGTHTYSTAGSYTASLTVTGPGGSNSTSTGITVTAPTPTPKPVAGFNANPTSGVAPLNVAFASQCTGIITTYSWDFGDSTTYNGQNPGTHTYNSAGTYTAKLTVTGPGGTDSISKTITVTTPRPVVAFTASPTYGLVPLSVAFTDKSSGIITSWSWTFGDGATSNVQNPGTHMYDAAGSYTAKLTVTGPGGSNDTSMVITVTTPTPTPKPVVAFTASPTAGVAPLDVAFTDRSSGSITSWSWTFGDGGTSSVQNPGIHTYTTAGSYTASLTVTGPGGSNSTSTGITVTTATPTPSPSPNSGIALTLDDDYVDEWYAMRGMFKAYGVKATFFITEFDRLTTQQINELKVLQSEGCEIACHGFRHLDAVSYIQSHTIANYVSTEITPAINAMKAQGFTPTDFAWPYGEFNSALNTEMYKYFDHLRGVTWGDGPLKDYDSNYYKWDGTRLIGCVATDNVEGRPVSEFTAGLDKAKANGWVLITLS
ncbi:MAG: PKD domain-containing protein, partial [Planctomycetaceae bacterium]